MQDPILMTEPQRTCDVAEPHIKADPILVARPKFYYGQANDTCEKYPAGTDVRYNGLTCGNIGAHNGGK